MHPCSAAVLQFALRWPESFLRWTPNNLIFLQRCSYAWLAQFMLQLMQVNSSVGTIQSNRSRALHC